VQAQGVGSKAYQSVPRMPRHDEAYMPTPPPEVQALLNKIGKGM